MPWFPHEWSQGQLFFLFPDAGLPCDGSQLGCLEVTTSEYYVSKAWCDGGLGNQAGPVGQEDVRDRITSC